MTGPNTKATAGRVTHPTLAAILKIDSACQRWKMREQGGGKQSNNGEVVWHRGEEGGGERRTWKAEGINKRRRIEEMMIGEEGVAWGVKRCLHYCVLSARHDLSVQTRYVYLCVKKSVFSPPQYEPVCIISNRENKRSKGARRSVEWVLLLRNSKT